MLPAPAVSRSASPWLRGVSLVAVGVLLLLPLTHLASLYFGHNRSVMARDSAEQFLHAWLQNDQAKLAPLLPQGVALHAGNLCLGPVQTSLLAPEVGAPDTQGDAAFVPFTVRYQPGDITLLVQPAAGIVEEPRLLDRINQDAQKQDGAHGVLQMSWQDGDWRAGALIYPANKNGQGPRVEFKALASLARADANITAFFALHAIDAADFEKMRRVDANVRDKPANRPPGVGFAGPFRIEVEGISEAPLFATGSLHLHASAGGFPTAILSPLDGWQPTLPAPEIRGPDGQDLYHTDRRDRIPLPRFHLDGGSAHLRWQIPLRNLTLGVDRIRSVRGRLPMPLPGRLDTGRVLLVGEKGTARIGPAELTWQRGLARASGLRLTVVQHKACRLHVLAVDVAGKGWITAAPPSSGTTDVPSLAAMAVLHIKVLTIEELQLPFELGDIPLPQRPPTRLAPVEFPGQPAPLSFQEKRLPQSQFILHVRNHTRKPVEEVRLTLRCLDGQGREVGRIALVHPLLVRQDKLPEPIVAAEGTAEIHPGVFLPAATARIAVDLWRVLFSDGTTWSPEGR